MDASILLNLDVFTLMLMALGGYSLGWAPSAREWHFDTLFSQADRALYQAKREGKNRICQGA
ncbi:hypothetical protein ACK3YN_03110 [Aeromonas caviae]|uniref:hypothetical protein n=1 Tax=Aeromonas caviae TaxID=648 RepID=UPI00191D0C7B|nr:hypothetical protein [Aeromonas caviae]MBL0647101.1 hypothetical protein [Aeromonas caviae]MDX7818269.1 hypothetical protein [Aeromonas caviae]